MMKMLEESELEERGVFTDQKSDFTISKKHFRENILIYINKGTISTIKGDLAIYTDCFILEQIFSTQNSSNDITT